MIYTQENQFFSNQGDQMEKNELMNNQVMAYYALSEKASFFQLKVHGFLTLSQESKNPLGQILQADQDRKFL